MNKDGVWMFAFKANAEKPWEVLSGSYEDMAHLFNYRSQNWTDVYLCEVHYGPTDVVGYGKQIVKIAPKFPSLLEPD